MAILWQKRHAGALYEVRAAGRTRRLYTDGVLHSEFNPDLRISGGVWDLLLLPAFFYPAGSIRRVLVLGVGGGSVIRKLHHYLGPREIVGVDLNPVHLSVARRFFGVNQPNVLLHHADAVRWLGGYRGPGFDMIIDDLFNGADGEPVRAVAADAKWFDAITRHLTRDGVFVANFPTRGELRECAYFSNRRVAGRFRSAFELSTPRLENAVGAFLRTQVRSLQAMPGQKTRRARSCWRIRRLAAPKPSGSE